MRIAEHHSYAPHVPVPCAAAVDGWDDGLATAFFPPSARFAPTDSYREGRGVAVRVDGDDVVHEYATYDPSAANEGEALHDPDVCAGCREREELLRAARARKAEAAREELFVRMGMGRSSSTHPSTSAPQDADGGDPDEGETETSPPAHDPTRVPPCTGIQDIIFTGAVSSISPIVSSFLPRPFPIPSP